MCVYEVYFVHVCLCVHSVCVSGVCCACLRYVCMCGVHVWVWVGYAFVCVVQQKSYSDYWLSIYGYRVIHFITLYCQHTVSHMVRSKINGSVITVGVVHG